MNKCLGKIYALGLAAALLSGCSAAPDAQNKENVKPLPVVTATLPGNEPAPQRTPAAAAQGSTDLDYSSLDGVAGPEDELPLLDYEQAQAQCANVIGWLSVPGAGIELPVVRADDNEYYLNHNILDKQSKYGAIFMDFRNADKEQQKHIIIYGHDMKNGTMFHGLLNYKQKSFFNENRIISFNWDGTDTMWEVYLATTIPTVDGHMINYVETRFADSAAFEDYMADMAAYARTAPSSTVSDTVSISQADQVLTLTTCTYEADGSRFIVQARRVR